MKALAILLAGLVAGPAAAQGMGGMNMPGMAGMNMPRAAAPAPKKQPAAKPAVKRPAQHKPARAAAGKSPAPGDGMASMPGMDMAAPAAPADPNCPPEHAAAGHCVPAAAPAPAGMPDMPGMAMPAATPPADPNCPPEHAAMGHCKPAAAALPAPAGMADMPGMTMPAAATPADPDCPPEHAAAGHCTPKPQAAPDPSAAGTALPAGSAPPPAPPTDRAADRFYPPAAMAMADRMMRREHGGMAFSQIMFNLAEYQVRDGRDGYRWEGEGWFGGDIHRLVVKSEGEGSLGGGAVEDAEVQALYSRAIDPYFNLQAGIRQDLGAGTKRTYATIGIEGLAPYWFEVEGRLFLSDRGDLLGRLEAYYDQRVTQRLILQPRIELNLAAQTVAASRVGAGLSNAELGLRLRYEIARTFAPYVGLSWDRKTGDTARFARAAGEGASTAAVALGIRTWF